MAQPLELVQEKIVGYDARGKREHTSRAYIKLDESAEALLGELQGVYLTFFLCVSLHEISVCSRGAMPYTRADVCRVTRKHDGKATISERAAIYAAKWLVENGFLYECGTRANGEKMYRPCGTYAWFGDDYHRGAKFAPLPDPGVQPTAPSGCNATQTGVQNDALRAGGGKASSSLNSSKVLSASPKLAAHAKNSADATRVRAALGRCGMYGARANALAARIELELAIRWERWCRYARANLNFASPEGIALYRLEEDPHAEPPDWADVLDWEHDQDAQHGAPTPERELTTPNDSGYAQTISDLALTARDLWCTVLDDARLQLPQATFDTWLRPSRALGFDGEILIVQTQSPYASEWLSVRLEMLIHRILIGIAGKMLTVRYVNPGGQK